MLTNLKAKILSHGVSHDCFDSNFKTKLEFAEDLFMQSLVPSTRRKQHFNPLEAAKVQVHFAGCCREVLFAREQQPVDIAEGSRQY